MDQIIDLDSNIGPFCILFGIDKVQRIMNNRAVPTKQYTQTKFLSFLTPTETRSVLN